MVTDSPVPEELLPDGVSGGHYPNNLAWVPARTYRPERDRRTQSYRKDFVYSAARVSEARLLAAVFFKVIEQLCRVPKRAWCFRVISSTSTIIAVLERVQKNESISNSGGLNHRGYAENGT